MATIAAAITTVAATTAAAADQSRTESGRGGKNLRALFLYFFGKKILAKRGGYGPKSLAISPKLVYYIGHQQDRRLSKGKRESRRVLSCVRNGRTHRAYWLRRGQATVYSQCLREAKETGTPFQSSYREVENLHEQISQTVCARGAGSP